MKIDVTNDVRTRYIQTLADHDVYPGDTSIQYTNFKRIDAFYKVVDSLRGKMNFRESVYFSS